MLERYLIMKAPSLTQINKSEKNAHYKYCVHFPIVENGLEVRKRKRFTKKDDAVAFLERQTIIHRNLGRHLLDFTQEEERALLSWRSAQRELNIIQFPTLESVLTKEIQRLRSLAQTAQLKTACEQLIDIQIKKGRSERTWKSTQGYLNKFREHMGDDTPLSSIGSEDIQEWFDALTVLDKNWMRENINRQNKNVIKTKKPSSTTVANHRTAINNLFIFALSNQWIDVNPVESTDTPDATLGKVHILSVPQLTSILNIAEGRLKACIAIQAFSGLRTSEVLRLKTEDINFLTMGISVGDESKTGKRMVKLTKNLKKILEPILDGTSGIIWNLSGDYLSKQMLKTWREANIPKHHNVLRHSFCTYHLAKHKDWAKTEYQAGNSKNILQKHYQRLVTEMEAKKWFKIK